MDGPYIQHGKNDGDAHDARQRMALRHPQGNEFMMDMVLVGSKRRFPVAQAMKHHPHHVQHRHHQERKSDHDTAGKKAVFDGIGFAEGYRHCSQHHADGERTGISHKDFPTAMYLSEHIIIEERNQDAQSGKGNKGVHPPMQAYEQAAEGKESYHAQSGSKTVDAVYQVDGIEDIDDDEYGERHTDVAGYLMDAEQTVEIVEIEPGED